MKKNLFNCKLLAMSFFFWKSIMPAEAQAPSDLFISEYVEGSSLNKALEFYNGTGSTIDLASGNYVVQMYFNGSATAGLTIPLTGTVVPNQVYLLSQTAAVFNTANGGTVTPNQTSAASWYNGDDAIVLRKGGATGMILDVIGQIGTDPGSEWGTGLLSTSDNSLRRKPAQCSGDQLPSDIFDPSAQWDGFATDDFSGLGAHTSSCAVSGPSIALTPISLSFTSTAGTPSTLQSYLVQGSSLSDSVFVSAPSAFELSLVNVGPFSSSLVLTNSQANSGTTIYVRYNPAIAGADNGSITHLSGSATASLTVQGTAVSGAITPIYAIQGQSAASVYDGSILTTEGIVTADFQGTTELRGFYLQDISGDGNTLTSDGIFVFNNTFPVNVGDHIRLTAEVDEFNNLTELKNLSALTVLSTGNSLMAPVAISLPVSSLTDLENYEGMLVTFPQSLTVTETFTLGRFGEVLLSANGRLTNPTNFVDPNDSPASGTTSSGSSNVAAVIAQQDLNNRRKILLDDASSVQNPAVVPFINPVDNTLRSGSTLSDLTGILDYAFGTYRVQPTVVPAFNYATRPLVPTVGNSNARIANFNVLNYFNGDGAGGGFPTARGANTPAEFARQRAKIIQAISQLDADVLGLMEMENDGDGATSAIADLVNGLNSATAPGTYAYVADPTGANGNTGTDAIKVALIYKPALVSPLGLSRADMDPSHNRPPLAQTFTLNSNGEKFTIIVNHFKSKSCTGSAGADADQNDGQGCYNNSRKLQAAALLNFIQAIQLSTGDQDVISVGDYNAYEQEDPMDLLMAGGLKNALTGTYSYVFDGQSGSLDHALVSSSLYNNITGAEKWHINADEPIFKDYNQEFNPAYVFSPDAYRSSDHDPVLVGLNLQPYTYKLQVLHASDFEGGAHAANFAALVDKFEDEYSNTVILSSGDNYIPSPFFSAGADRTALDATYRNVYNQHFGAGSSNFLRAGIGRADISVANLIGLQASALGNHEFDAGTGVVSEIIGYEISGTEVRWMGAQFPYLSANLDFSADPALNPLFTNQILSNTAYISRPDTLKSTSPKRKIAPATIITVNGEKIGVIGATTQILESISSTGGVKVKGSKTNNMPELAGYIQPVIDQLTAQGINKIILLSHLQQIAFEKELIGLLQNIDIVIAGGSSTLLSDSTDVLRPGDVSAGIYPYATQNAGGQFALVVNTDQEYKYLGRLIVDFDMNGVILPSSLDPTVNGVYASTDENVITAWGSLSNAFAPGTKGNRVKTLVEAVNNVIIAKDGNVLGKTSVYLEGLRTEVRTQETNLGNISSDANIYIGKTYDSTVVVSIKNGGGIRSAIGEIRAIPASGTYEELPPQANPLSGKQTGEISQLDIENSLRFNNSLSLVTVTATQLLQVLNHGVAAVAPGATPGQFAQVGGVSFSYNPSLAPGSRVRNAAIIDEHGNLIEVLAKDGVIQGDPGRPIRVVTLTFLLTGGDSYPFNTFIAANSVFANRRDLVILGAAKTGNATFTDNGSEQDAFAEYLSEKYASVPYNVVDTDISEDDRIQNLAFRNDSILNARPTVGITSPLNGASFITGSDIVITVEAADIDGAVAKVEFYNGANKIGEDTLSPFDYTWNNVAAGNYALVARATDNRGLQSVSDTVLIAVEACIGAGSITREYFANIYGAMVSNLTSHRNFPDNPTSVSDLVKFEAPRNIGNLYGTRIRGYVCAPLTGNYTFYIASDETSELWLSTDELPANKVKIAFVSSAVAPRAWKATPSQISSPIMLVAGAKYYIEALHKESSKGDHFAVAWTLPTGKSEAPIPGIRLSPWSVLVPVAREADFFNDAAVLEQLMVYPLVSQDIVNVSFNSSEEGKADVTLTNMHSSKVMNLEKAIYSGENNFEINVNGLADGMYVLHVSLNGKEYAKKIIVLKN